MERTINIKNLDSFEREREKEVSYKVRESNAGTKIDDGKRKLLREREVDSKKCTC